MAKTTKPADQPTGHIGAKFTIDWELIEKHYRAGILSLRDICKAADSAVTESAIRKRAKRDQWTRNLTAKIEQRAEELVRKEAVRKPGTQLTPASEAQVVEANADLQYRVRISQRGDIQRSRSLMVKLLSELEITTDNAELFAQLGELLDESGPDANGNWKADRRNELYAKVISLTGRVDNSKKLIEMLEKLVKLERQAFGITDGEDDSKGNIEDLLAKIGLKAKGLANG